MKRIALHGKYGEGKYAIVDDADYEMLSQYNWIGSTHGYACRAYRDHGTPRLTPMHEFILGKRQGFVIDHVNRNILDNRRANLRHATRAQNSRNSGLYKNNTCGYRGVHLTGSRWMAMIRVNGKRVYLGMFNTAKEAAQAYDKAVRKRNDNRAYLNFP